VENQICHTQCYEKLAVTEIIEDEGPSLDPVLVEVAKSKLICWNSATYTMGPGSYS